MKVQGDICCIEDREGAARTARCARPHTAPATGLSLDIIASSSAFPLFQLRRFVELTTPTPALTTMTVRAMKLTTVIAALTSLGFIVATPVQPASARVGMAATSESAASPRKLVERSPPDLGEGK